MKDSLDKFYQYEWQDMLNYMLSTGMWEHDQTTEQIFFRSFLKLLRHCHTTLRMKQVGSDFYVTFTPLRYNVVALKVAETKRHLLGLRQCHFDRVAEGYK